METITRDVMHTILSLYLLAMYRFFLITLYNKCIQSSVDIKRVIVDSKLIKLIIF